MYTFEFDSIDESFQPLVKALLESGNDVSPRGQLTKELSPVSITIKNPRKRVITHPVRKANYGFMVAELLWILRGSNSAKEIGHYNKQWLRFTDDGETLNGAYGQRIFDWTALSYAETPTGKVAYQGTVNQFQAVIDRLKNDPDSRHGTIVFWNPATDTKPSKDLPCTNLLRFKIRNGKLDMITFMRSNDVWLGYTYDVYNFTMLQEIMAGMLDVEVGTYTHVVDSFHIYEMHFEAGRQLIEQGPTNVYAEVEPMDYRLGEDHDKILDLIQGIEELTRQYVDGSDLSNHPGTIEIDARMQVLKALSPAWASLAGVIAQYNYKKVKDEARITQAQSYITNEFAQALGLIKEETTMAEHENQVVDADFEVVKDEATEAAQEAPQEGLQKITIETDGTLQNTVIKFDGQPVPMLTRVEFTADVSEGVVMHLHQVQVDEEGKPLTDEEGQVKVNTFTVTRQGAPAESENDNIASSAADLAE